MTKAFLLQYKHMIDTTLDRISLQNMEKKANEIFCEYAHKWRDLEARVQPPLTDKELNKMFLNTLKTPYYNWMIENSNKDLSDVVSVGEMIENGVKLRKIENTETKKPTFKRKEWETHTMLYQKRAYNPSYPPQQNYGYQPYNQYDRNVAQRNYKLNYTPTARFPTLW